MRDTSGNVAAWFVMVLTPLFFSTNLIFGSVTVPVVAPATLAFLRWGIVALVLAPFAWPHVSRALPWRRLFSLSFLGMVICGAVVYAALRLTTATNATLVYTSSPVIVLLIERLSGTPLGVRKAAGCALATVGVAIILFDGDLAKLLRLSPNLGDLLILGCAIAWAVYSIEFRHPAVSALPPATALCLIAGCGATILAPFAAAEWFAGAPMPATSRAWIGLAGIVLMSSLLAFGGYQFGLRSFGAQRTSAFMYLLPAYGVLLAVLVLGEPFRTYHAVGIATVLGGVVLATLAIKPRAKAPG